MGHSENRGESSVFAHRSFWTTFRSKDLLKCGSPPTLRNKIATNFTNSSSQTHQACPLRLALHSTRGVVVKETTRVLDSVICPSGRSSTTSSSCDNVNTNDPCTLGRGKSKLETSFDIPNERRSAVTITMKRNLSTIPGTCSPNTHTSVRIICQFE